MDAETISTVLTAPEEFALIKKLSEFDSVVIEAKNQLAPYSICRYLLDMAKLLNSYYAAVHIMKSEEHVKKARVMLLGKVRDTLQK